MKIPVGYMDRRREGDTVLRQTQLVLLHLLHVIDRICSENGIRYWLAWGSCLGAMRHDGFIPWDDDMDIGLSVKDFKRLIKLLPRELPEDARLQVPADCPKVAIPFPKVRDCSSFLFESRPDISTADPSGIYIDIFPFVEIPKVPKVVSDVFYTVCGSSYHRYHFFLNKGARSVRSALWCVPLAAACRAVNLAAKGLLWLLRKILPCPYVGDVFDHGCNFRYRKEWFSSTKKHKFEDGEFPVPVGAEDYLSVRYGDWHVIPPPEERPSHARIVDPFRAAT